MGRYTVRQMRRLLRTRYAILDSQSGRKIAIVRSLEEATMAAFAMNCQYGRVQQATARANDRQWAAMIR